MRERLASGLESVGRVLGWIGIAILGILPFPVAYDAVARAFGSPTIWVFETSLYGLVVAGFLANALALSSGSHFRIAFLGFAFPGARKWLDRFALVVTLIFSVVFTAASVRFVLYSWDFDIRSNSLLSVPQYLPQLALPIGGMALALQAVVHLLRDEMPGHESDEAAAGVPQNVGGGE